MLGTRNLLEAIADANRPVRRVVLASSANIYGNARVEPITEDTAPAPANDYAVSKLAMECIARLWMDRLPIVITRPFNYTGVGQAPQFLLPKIVAHFRRREPEIALGNIRVWRDFSDVRDVAQAYRGLIEQGECGQVFNLCSGQAHSLEDVLDMMAGIAGYRIAVRVDPALIRASEVVRLVGSGNKLASVLGPRQLIPLRETLQWMYTGEREHGAGVKRSGTA
jgi:nucleoside-diphosphate-sugar epimerase